MLIPFMRRCGRFLHCERAVSALEYAILAGVVIAGVGAAIAAFSGNIADSIENIGKAIGKSTTAVEGKTDLDPN